MNEWIGGKVVEFRFLVLAFVTVAVVCVLGEMAIFGILYGVLNVMISSLTLAVLISSLPFLKVYFSCL